MKITRREVLIAGGATIISAILTDPLGLREYNGEIINTYGLPETPQPIDSARLTELLSSKTPIEHGGDVPEILNVIQWIRLQMDGSTVQEQMKNTFGQHEPPLSDVIEVRIADKLQRSGRRGAFFHSPSTDGPNFALIDGSLTPLEALLTINHELVHATSGAGEIKPYILTLKQMAWLSAKHLPQLELSDKSPIGQGLDEITATATDARLSKNYTDIWLGCCQFLYEKAPKPSAESLSHALDKQYEGWAGSAPDLDSEYERRYREMRQRAGWDHVREIHRHVTSCAGLYWEAVKDGRV